MMQPAPLPIPRVEDSWYTESLKGGESIFGYLVGMPYGAWTHYSKFKEASKPCRHSMSSQRLPCLHCKETKPRWIGYAPFVIGPDAKRRYYILSKTVAQKVTREQLLKPHELHRPEGKGQKYKLTSATSAQIGFPLTAFQEPLHADDTARYLFHLWGDEVLAEFYGYHLPKPTIPIPDPRDEQKSRQQPDGARQSAVVTPADLVRHIANGYSTAPETDAGKTADQRGTGTGRKQTHKRTG